MKKPWGTRARARTVAASLLTVAVLVAFWPVLSNGFTLFDDAKYVTDNPRVLGGLSLPGLEWAWTTGHASNWHPLTWISHMLDWELFGENAAGHHAVSLGLHLANTLLLFLLLERSTGSVWRSAAASALFGVHPLHVESVAWVAERKDVLSTAFWLLATLAYVRYARRSEARSYWLSVVLLALGLCAKPMLVTLPLTLLLLDYWPLGRWPAGGGPGGRAPFPWHLVREKVPMLALAAASSAVTLLVQAAGGAVRPLEELPLAARAWNAPIAYATYLRRAVWPAGLAVFYPHPGTTPPAFLLAVAAVVLLALTLLALRLRRSRPYLPVGWFWYLGTLVPVLGLVQVGAQSTADRYTYVPLIGVFVIAAWGAHDLASRLLGAGRPWSRGTVVAAGVWGLVLLALVAATRAQVRHWRSSISLFERAVAVTDGNALAHNNLGHALLDAGDAAGALRSFEEAVRISPSYAAAHNNLCHALSGLGRLDEAAEHCSAALRFRADYPEARNNLGIVLARRGLTAEAVAELTEALRLRPDYPEALNNLGRTLLEDGRTEEALGRLERAVALRPNYAAAHGNLGRALWELGRTAPAVRHLERAIELDPAQDEAHNQLGIVRLRTGRPGEAARHCAEALRLRPDYPEALNNLGAALTAQGRLVGALEALDRALRLRPSYAEAHSNRAAALYLAGDHARAREAVESARRHGLEPPSRLVELLSAESPPPRPDPGGAP